MSKVIVDMTLSLDGFIAGPDDTSSQPLGGRNAMRLHDWLLGGSELYEGSTFLRPEGRNREFVDALFRTTGALLAGRRTYDIANGWGGSHPISGLPVVVLTHAPPTDVPEGQIVVYILHTGRGKSSRCSKETSQRERRHGPWRQYDTTTSGGRARG